MTDIPLGPFTDEEARRLLASKDVVAQPVVKEVLRLTGGLPVLVSTLAEARPADPHDVGDPSATAVERFLKWEQDSARRTVALACALPRWLDADIFRAVVDCSDEEADALLAWLRGMPFVSERGEQLRYHDVVRAPMLRLQRLRSPRGWTDRHARLASEFGRWRTETEADLPADELWRDDRWRELRLAEAYHLLCAKPRTALPLVLRDLVDACGAGEVVARRWAQALVQAGQDTDAEGVRACGDDVLAGLDTGGVLGALGVLLAKGLDTRGRAEAHRLRGIEIGSAGDHVAAQAQFEQAITFNPDSAPAHMGRATARAQQGDYSGAVAALNRADELAPGKAGIIALRGDYQRLMGDYAAALRDLDRAIELAPARKTAWASRGVARLMSEDLDGATSDLDHALDLDPGYVWALVRRARVWRRRGDQARRLADLDRAAALEPDTPWVLCERGDALAGVDRREDALADYDRAIALDAEYTSAYASRGVCRYGLGQRAEALADLDRALELDPEYVWALWHRASVHRALGARELALADVERALALDPDHWMAQWVRLRIEAKRMLNGQHWAGLTQFRNWLEAPPVEPYDVGRLAEDWGIPEEELAETLQRIREIPTADRADLARRLTEFLGGREEMLDLIEGRVSGS